MYAGAGHGAAWQPEDTAQSRSCPHQRRANAHVSGGFPLS